MSFRYSMSEFCSSQIGSSPIYIVAPGEDERAYAATKILSNSDNMIKDIILIKYKEYPEDSVQQFFPGVRIHSIRVTSDITSFIQQLRSHEALLNSSDILVDITAIQIPEMFAMFKYLKMINQHATLRIAYSTPIEYEFPDEPFTSYHSYYGNLRTNDLAGFGGMSTDMSYSQMIIFLGFEGVLSAKVSEDIKYDKLILVNNLPSFYEKYKDISVINNYELLGTRHEKMAYVPANNPFETYNFLCEQLGDLKTACVAPLSTKPVALGVCLYALSHEHLRVVYPMADDYCLHRANSVHRTYLYTVPLDNL